MRGLSLRVKVFFLFAGAALLIVVPALLLIASAVEKQAYRRASDDLDGAGRLLAERWGERGERLTDKVMLKVSDSTLTAAWAAGRSRARLERRLSEDTDKEVVIAVDTTYRRVAGPELSREVLEGVAGGPA